MKRFETDFKEWYGNYYLFGKDYPEYSFKPHYEHFIKLPFSMRWGVYLEFFDSVGISVGSMKQSKNWYKAHAFIHDFRCNTRKEAQQEAIKKAIEIYEKNNTNN